MERAPRPWLESGVLPRLEVPFALLGSAAGYLSVTTLANPSVGLTVLRVPWVAALSTALVGLGTGAYLRRRCQAESSMASWGARWVYLLCALLVAGALSGAVVGVAGTIDGYGLLPAACVYAATAGAAGGAMCALLFAPICGWVLAAARRARRARHGSIVAGSDVRAVWGILATALALATLLALLDWRALRLGAMDGVPPPYPALALTLGGCALTAVLLLADLWALRRLGRVARHTAAMEERASEDGSSVEADCKVLDFGLGRGQLARVTRGAAYRGRERVTALLVGSAAEATAALRRAVRGSGLRLLLIGGVLWAHGVGVVDLDRAERARITAGPLGGLQGVVQGRSLTAGPRSPRGHRPTALERYALDHAGTLSPEEVRRVVGSARAALQSCYGPRFGQGSRLTVMVRFVIELDGRVSEAEVRSGLAHPEVAGCVEQRFAELRFPAPRGGKVTVHYPVALGGRAGAGALGERRRRTGRGACRGEPHASRRLPAHGRPAGRPTELAKPVPQLPRV